MADRYRTNESSAKNSERRKSVSLIRNNNPTRNKSPLPQPQCNQVIPIAIFATVNYYCLLKHYAPILLTGSRSADPFRRRHGRNKLFRKRKINFK
ncbi:hypothetical protein CEXT_416321 [Caerostris extrusa]|uniref:Uncharacterized protein n=1 Tax=Caerostris extrusa TaxID=172846 RepID=A0AAV4XG39_CAEEX|nr:hypothetical protein CEXT_416321 [Caerostris extrusa]